MLSGSFAELANLAAALKATGANVIPTATKAIAGAVGTEYRRGILSHVSPWGDAWAPSRRGTTGFRTGDMLAAIPTISGPNVRMRPPRYWSYFQAGAPTKLATPRGILPFGPSQWDVPVEAKAREAIESHFTGLGATK